jgi:hypothetical protein
MDEGGSRDDQCVEGDVGGVMELWSRINSVCRNLFRRQQVEGQLDDEVRAYVDMVADERIAAGMSASEARRTALAEFGGI